MILLALLLATAGIETDPEFKQATAQVEAFEYDKAATLLESISKRPGIANEDRALALVWLGMVYAELRDEARASVAFEDAVVADPLTVLPGDASPKVKKLLEDARGRVRLRPKTNTTNTTTTTTTAPTLIPETGTGAPGDSGTAPAAPASSSGVSPIALGTLVTGGVIAVIGGVVWGVGLALNQQAIDAKFQSDAVELSNQSAPLQVGGQIATGVGVVTAIVGGVLFVVE